MGGFGLPLLSPEQPLEKRIQMCPFLQGIFVSKRRETEYGRYYRTARR